MLRGLDIRDMLIIDRLELAFQPGLNVLTGETGAGKSILLDSLGFVLGWRGRAELVRAGASQGEVTAWFDLPEDHAAREVLREAGLPEGDELILRRVNSADGRKTAWVNDRRSSGEVLRRISETLVELHGQHDDRGLLNARGHRALLDAFAGASERVADVRAAWASWREVNEKLAEARQRIEALRNEEDFLRHAVAELDALGLEPGEEEELDARRRLMQGAEKVREDISRAHAAISGEGAEGLVADALRWLDGAAEGAGSRLDAPLEALSRAMDALGDAEQGVAACLEDLAFDPREMDRITERLFAIRDLARKHKVQPDDLVALAETLRTRLAALEGGEGDLAALEAEATACGQAHHAACEALHELRAEAAARLDAAMAAELAPLKMDRAVFSTVLSAAEPGPEGADEVTFTVATNPGAPAGPLNRIASGGELSRFLLALKVCLMGKATGITMIFDEIDRGVGGATADAVGRRLKGLAEGAQVLVVTHSPQVAALGGHHWRVEKRVEGETTLSTVVPLEADARVDELARMLSGDRVTSEARAAARSLLGT
ncbi:DNA replication and repair protein RecN [Aliiruegeria haliotis]|uniref:DNA repair protein RecN n=1 Tax=Aliiruegeria haliotis TaxID=1280846 RepID=A0A2T0RXV2_9RHOB|nr:DNA repair protein RecN [Aliiruegeria haliotis]PRY26014.1 DNA replication and repair protein RecN [Aliiruegeria haliotis]